MTFLATRVPPTGTGYAASGEKTGWPLYTPCYHGTFVSRPLVAPTRR
ncbi:hypothetical protein [Streptomyces sp. GESEQ-35]|nr:hypothetical protein [Streptomyces sp. GESEQ-35]